jgi:hypothetical protein
MKLDTSVGVSGPHDFAVRNVALSSAAPPASIASRPYVRDDRETPLCVGRDGETMEVIWVKREGAIFLREGLDSESVILPNDGRVNDAPIISAVVHGIYRPCAGHPRLDCANPGERRGWSGHSPAMTFIPGAPSWAGLNAQSHYPLTTCPQRIQGLSTALCTETYRVDSRVCRPVSTGLRDMRAARRLPPRAVSLAAKGRRFQC